MQGYLAVDVQGVEVRLRRRGEGTYLTAKRGTGELRDEAEIELSTEQFEALWPLTRRRRLSKVRHYLPTEAGEIEVDVYKGSLEGLITAEIEFATPEEAEDFELPEWLGEELTGDPRYANQSLASRGAPGDASVPEPSPDSRRHRDRARDRILATMVKRAGEAGQTGAAVKPPVGASLAAPGARLESALAQLGERPDATGRDRLSRCCLEYGAAAIAVAEALLRTERLTAQVRPTTDDIIELVAEQGLDRDWPRSTAPMDAWREVFSANHTAIIDGTDPPAGLFDRLIAVAGLAAELCTWIRDPGATTELSGRAGGPSTHQGG